MNSFIRGVRVRKEAKVQQQGAIFIALVHLASKKFFGFFMTNQCNFMS